jgi:hypothetical protein
MVVTSSIVAGPDLARLPASSHYGNTLSKVNQTIKGLISFNFVSRETFILLDVAG